MYEKLNETSASVMNRRFGRDALYALATVDKDGAPHVRTVNGYYENGSIYIITYALSRKMTQLAHDSRAAVSGDWFTANGHGRSIGPLLAPENKRLADTLKDAFSAWYGNGHINESDPNTVILEIRLQSGILFDHGSRYEIDFT